MMKGKLCYVLLEFSQFGQLSFLVDREARLASILMIPQHSDHRTKFWIKQILRFIQHFCRDSFSSRFRVRHINPIALEPKSIEHNYILLFKLMWWTTQLLLLCPSWSRGLYMKWSSKMITNRIHPFLPSAYYQCWKGHKNETRRQL